MGREASCKCDWNGTIAEVKVLLEFGEIILRGELRKRLPLTEVRNVKVLSDRLSFTAGGEQVQLLLGPVAAERWAAAMKAPPASLARKLGITDKTIFRTMGCVEDDALKAALGEAQRISAKEANLIVACVDTAESLHAVLRAARAQLLSDIPIWIVYAKGPGHSLNEAAIRDWLRDQGMMDNKVASVSAKLTALRFSLRKSNQG
jgi:hypothetical protein